MKKIILALVIIIIPVLSGCSAEKPVVSKENLPQISSLTQSTQVSTAVESTKAVLQAETSAIASKARPKTTIIVSTVPEGPPIKPGTHNGGQTDESAYSSSVTDESQVSGTQIVEGDDTPIEWPKDLMGDLPQPGGTITSIDRGNDIWGMDAPSWIIVVSIKDIFREDCIIYINKLKKLGFKQGVFENTDSKISFSGSLENKNVSVSFSYNLLANKGFVAYNPKNSDIIENK